MEKKKASLTLSSLAIVLIVAFIAVGIGVFNVNIAILLFLCWMIMWPFAAHLGYSFSEMEGFAYEMAQKCIAPAAIILAVGMMIASFIAAGTVPTILVAGLKLITPKFFLALTFVMCCIMSVIMGTSWGTLGTVGIAMMGVGAGLSVNPAITAGAVVSGAWFGDKMSPMSDSTIMCSTSIMNGLKGMFHINLIPVIPIVVVIVMILMKKGTIVSMMSGTVVAILIAVFYQGYSVADMGTFLYSGFTCETKNGILISLLNRGGMTSMLSLLAVFVGGLGLGGILDKTGMLEPIFHYITEKYKSPRGIMLMAWCATLLCILVIADNNFAFVMVATLFGSAFQKYNLKSQNLSRILEDVGTLGSALVPWNVGAQFAAGVLGVSTLAYMPYAFLNWMTPILSLAFIILQVKIKKIEE